MFIVKFSEIPSSVHNENKMNITIKSTHQVYGEHNSLVKIYLK